MVDRDIPYIDEGNPNWVVVKTWAMGRLEELRQMREQAGMDVRQLDMLLGGINQLKDLTQLPANLKRERERDPITGDDFAIPTPKGY